MKELFGIPMNTIMFVLVALFVVCASAFVWTFLANRIMFRMGLRNIGRRRSQSVLVVAGLMLATVIITASFATGDTLDRSITNLAYDNLQRIDLSLHHFRSADEPADVTDAGGRYYVPTQTLAAFERAFANDPDIEGFIPSLFEGLPVFDQRSKQTEPTVVFSGIDPPTVERFGGIHAAGGGRADLAGLKPDEVFLNKTAADALDAREGDEITVYARDQSFNLRVAGIVNDERLSGALDFGMENGAVSGMVGLLSTVQVITGHEGEISSINVVLRGDARSSLARSDAAEERLEAFKDDEARKAAAGLGGVSFQVEANKKDAVDAAELWGNIFTTMFLILGLFSIAAGIMLIFTLFIMLAAERRTEMGIARAVGAERSHIVQAFLAEGMVYDFVAGLIGVVIGVAVAAVVIVGGTRLAFGDTLSFVRPYVSLQTLVISFTLGAVLTFITVVVSSVRISQLNIVAAVRGQQDRRTGREARLATRWRWVALGVPMTIVFAPLGLYWLLRKGFGLPWGLVVGPAGLVAAALSLWAGVAAEIMFFFSLGVSLVPLSLAALARYYGAPARLTWTVTGALLAIYWLAPENFLSFGLDLSANMEMFVFSGVMIVTALTLIIVFNARLITALYASGLPGVAKYRVPAVLLLAVLALVALGAGMGDAASGLGELAYLAAIFVGIFLALSVISIRFPRFAPALKMGVAYPLASRTRTGMTIAMFSIVIFSITVMGIINNAFLEMFAGDEGRGGWDIYAETNRNNPVPDLKAALDEEGSYDPGQIAVIGRTSVFDRFREVRKAGDETWEEYPVLAGDEAWFGQSEMKLEGRARGYASDAEVWRALQEKPNTALVPSDIVAAQGGNLGNSEFHVGGVSIKDEQFEPFDLEFRDPATGKAGRVTVIGVATSKIPTGMLIGLFVNEQTYRPVFGAPEYTTLFIRLQPGVDPQQAARGIEAALVEKGVQADSIKKLIDDALAASRGFLRVFQVFMGLGLLVGIASLGVIALRSVVERRQQIGMLRAIGYQRSTVALSFLLESGFVALMGIIAGIGGAAILSYNLLQTDTWTGTTSLTFSIPWVDVVSYGVISFLFAMLMTWWPSRRAASVPIAEALRYE